ncbi:MAG: hypothetical protein R3283_06380, partial [Balneolaceae bacterium]|nr:hypothetical protein [Balneolaceae bacterium]
MAELKDSELYEFSAAAIALTLITGRKLIRNFRYYRSSEPDRIYREELIALCIAIRKDAFSLHNLMCRTEEHPAYFVALAGRISDRFEELHRKLLFFDPDDIEDAVKLIDSQRAFWKKSENPEFYDGHLLSTLENRVPDLMLKTEKYLKQL